MDINKNLFVCSLAQMPDFVKKYQITHMITLMSEYEIKEDGFVFPKELNPDNWLHIDIRDTSNHTFRKAPKIYHIQKIIEWANNLPEDANLLVHCYAGISRSTATALMIAVLKNGIDSIDDSFNWLIRHRPIAIPNILMIELADYALDANGKLYDKVIDYHESIKGKLII